MADNLCMIKSVKERMTNWTVQAMVIERGYPRVTSGDQTYQKLVLIDSEVSIIPPMPLSKKSTFRFMILNN